MSAASTSGSCSKARDQPEPSCFLPSTLTIIKFPGVIASLGFLIFTHLPSRLGLGLRAQFISFMCIYPSSAPKITRA